MTRAESRALDSRIRELAACVPVLSVTEIAARIDMERSAVSHRLARMGITREAPPPANRVSTRVRAQILRDVAKGWSGATVAMMNRVCPRTVGNVRAEAR